MGIKNNIFANYSSLTTANSPIMFFADATQQIGSVSNNNVFYNAILGCIGSVVNTTENLATWQARGYDLNSVEQNPLLYNQTDKPYPVTPIRVGAALASPFDTGLNVTTDFKIGQSALPIIANNYQSGTYQNGPYIQ